MPYLEAVSQHLPGESEKNYENSQFHNQYPGRDLNWVRPEDKFRALSLHHHAHCDKVIQQCRFT